MRTIIYSLVALIALAVLVAGCAGKTEAPSTPVMPAPDTRVDTVPADEEVVPSAMPTEVLSMGECTNNKVAFTLANTGSTDMAVSDIEFRLNEAIDASPECGAETLAPGEETRCVGLDQVPAGPAPVAMVTLPDNSDHTLKVRCS